MTPYYQDDLCTIYHGDCRYILPHLEADCVITDPPWPQAAKDFYCEGAQQAFREACPLFAMICNRAVIQMGCNSDPRFLSEMPEN